MPGQATFRRWPWSWPVDVPVRLVDDDGAVIELTSRGTIYDFAAHVGKGYTGTKTYGTGETSLGRVYNASRCTILFEPTNEPMAFKLR